MVPAQVQARQEQVRLPRRARGEDLLHGEVRGEQGLRHRVDGGPEVGRGLLKEGEAQGIAAVPEQGGQQPGWISAQLGNEGIEVNYNRPRQLDQAH